MNKISNQDIEKYYFDKFRKDYSLPFGDLNYKDSPDVIIDGERRIGIEITNFFHEKGSILESEQVQRSLREKVVSEAQRIYQSENGKKIEISFGFDKTNPIQVRKKLVKKLVGLAKLIEKSKKGEVRKNLFNNISELSFVYFNPEEYEDAMWRVIQVYNGPMISRDRLIEIVRDKEVRAKKYKKCDAFWLLVVIDFINPAQDQEIQIDDFKKIQSETFEKVIVYKTVFGHVLEAK